MFRTMIVLCWFDLDAQGHADNAVIADCLQEARTAFFRAGPCSGLLNSGVVVAGHRTSYLAPTTYSNAGIDTGVAVTWLGGARFGVAYALLQGAAPVARARTMLCPFGSETQQPARPTLTDRGWPAEYRAEVEPMCHIDVPDFDRDGLVMPCPVRWLGLDSYKHVNNVRVLNHLMQARIAAATSQNPAMARSGAREAPLNWLIARQDVDYINQITHRMDLYAVHTAPTVLGHIPMTLAVGIFNPDDDTALARGRTILAAADGEGKSVALPEEVRKDLTKRLID